jgi:hypothetical protein
MNERCLLLQRQATLALDDSAPPVLMSSHLTRTRLVLVVIAGIIGGGPSDGFMFFRILQT